MEKDRKRSRDKTTPRFRAAATLAAPRFINKKISVVEYPIGRRGTSTISTNRDWQAADFYVCKSLEIVDAKIQDLSWKTCFFKKLQRAFCIAVMRSNNSCLYGREIQTEICFVLSFPGHQSLNNNFKQESMNWIGSSWKRLNILKKFESEKEKVKLFEIGRWRGNFGAVARRSRLC